MKRLILALVLAAPLAHAQELTIDDWKRQAAHTALLLADYAQTVDIYRRPKEFHEVNPLLRKNWSEVGIRNYFIASAALNLAVTRALPAEWRPAWQYTHIVFEALVVLHNRKAGVNFKF